MHYLRRTFRGPPLSFSPSLRHPTCLILSQRLSSPSVVPYPRWQFPHRPFSTISLVEHDFFDYTSGRWLVNDSLRLAERRREFEVGELRRLAAESVGRHSGDIATFVKLAEGGFNRTFLITMHDGFEMVARIPYPITIPKFYTVASEVATMRFLRSRGIPIPEVYGYSATSDNSAKTEYIFMEFVKGTELTKVWREMEDADMASVLRHLVQLESQMMSISFPAGGSLYYARDLEMTGKKLILLEDERFCVGPDVGLHMWYGRRSQLDVGRAPYESAVEVLEAAAYKEIAYLERFGRPCLPFQRKRREAYEYKVQSPSDHVENLKRYLLMAPSFLPKNHALIDFRIRHPDLQPGNVMVSRSDETNELRIISLLDWQHASILPSFLSAGIPSRMHNYGDPASEALIPPSQLRPANLEGQDELERNAAMELYQRRLVHYLYVTNTQECNPLHAELLSDSYSMFIRRLFEEAGSPWEGEGHALKASLIEATEKWATVTGGAPCPVVFEVEDLRKTKELGDRLRLAEENLEGLQGLIGFGPETWVPPGHYALASHIAQQVKESVFSMLSEDDFPIATANWFLDDMDEEAYK